MHSQDGPTFSTVEDSPIFRSTLSELDESLERLDIRCNRFMKGSKRYKEGINTLSQSQHSFADFLEEFCGGTDEESMILGGDKMSKFVPVFRELATFTEVLHTQIELILVERLHHNWLKGLISGGKESKRHLDKKMADYTAASAKHLHPRPTSKWRRGEDAEKIHSDMIAAQGAAEEARFDRARKMTEVESRKKYEFLEAMCSSMDAHVRFFERGHELLKDLGPYIQQGLQRVQQQKAEEIQHEENLENQIYNYKEQKSARGARAADVAERPPPRPGGPVQLTSGVSANIAAWEPLIKESEETQGGRVMILREGWLLKRSSNMRKEWKRRYFVLDSMGMLYYYSNKEKVDKKKTPYNTVNLLTSTIKSGADEEGLQGLRFCFRVVSPEKVYLLQAEDELDQREWMEAVQGVTACLLNGNVDVEALSRAQPKPSRPTHSRQGSRAGSISSLDDVSFSPLCQQLSQQSSGFSVDMGAALDAEGFGRSSEEQQQSPHAASSPVRRGNPLGRSPLAFAGMKGWEGRRTSHHASSNSMGSIRSPTQADRLLLNQGSVSSLATQGSNKLFPRAASPSSPLELLRRVPGNSVCCDCGSPEPDWASLNLGVLLCIECSGIHRKKGVHVSKVRSLTLDVRIWDEAVLGMMERIGNDVANEAWEAELVNENASNDGAESIGPADKATALDRASSYDSRARSDSDASHQSFSFTAAPRPPQEAVPPQGGASLGRQGLQRRGSIPYSPTPSQSGSMRGAPPHQPPSAKPSPDSNNAVKERFITAKYVEKRYAMTAVPAALGTPQTALWEACEGRSIREAVIAVVNGCDMNAPCPCPPAMSLIRDTNNLAGGANAEAPSSPAGFCALHFACQTGDISLIEYLLQNGATWDRSDPYGRTPLHYCILHEHPQAAKQLLKRGADKAAQDVLGQKPLDMLIKQGKVSDEELLMMLS